MGSKLTTTEKRKMYRVVNSSGDYQQVYPQTISEQVIVATSPEKNLSTKLTEMDAAIASAGQVDDVKINNTSVVSSKNANIAVDGTYNSSTNKVASQSTVTNAINALDSSQTADTNYALASVTQTDGKLTAKTQIKIPNSASEVGLGNVTNDAQMKAFVTSPTADKIVISTANSNQVAVSDKSVQDIVDIANGKTASYVIASQSNITGTKDANDNYTNVTAITGVTLANLKLGDVILLTTVEQPDYWVSQVSPSVSLNKMETSKVDITTKVDKLTTANTHLYSHTGSTQGELSLVTSATSSSTDAQVATAKAVYTADKTNADNITANANAITNIVNGTTTVGKASDSDKLGNVAAASYALKTDLNSYQPLDADLTAIAGLTGTSGFLKKTAANTWSLDTSPTATTTLTGDVTGSGTGTVATTLATVTTAGTNKTAVNYNAKGLVTGGGNAFEFGTSSSNVPSADLMVNGIFFELQS